MGIAAAIANRWFVRRNGLAHVMAALLVQRVARTQPGAGGGRLTGCGSRRSKRRA
jgi:hypothetical protein